MRTALAIRHVAFEDLGVFETVLSGRGVAVRYADAGVDDLEALAAARPDLLVVLGGPIGVGDQAHYPFLEAELRLIARRLEAGAPLIGVCLGAQLIARAAGARVYAGARKEIGFAPVTLTEAGEASCLAALRQADGMVLHWHGDTFDLPAGAVGLAATEVTPNQAFSLGPAALALQFHMEADPRKIERWLVGHTLELSQAGLDVKALRADAQRLGYGVAEAGMAAFSAWLDGVAR